MLPENRDRIKPRAAKILTAQDRLNSYRRKGMEKVENGSDKNENQMDSHGCPDRGP